MRRNVRLGVGLAVATLGTVFITSGSAQAILQQLTGKPAECDSCDRAGWQNPADDAGIPVLKIHGDPRNRLLTEEQMLDSDDPSDADDQDQSSDDDGTPDSGGANVFVNDPCLDPAPEAPFPENFRRTVQSETEIAVLNSVGDDGDDGDDDDDDDRSGRLMVAGYNDSFGFYDNRQGLSGFSYSTDGGKLWIDAGSLPPRVPTGAPAGTPGSDAYFGDPVLVVHHRTKFFYYASIYQNPQGLSTLSVNRGQFKVAPQQSPVESKANTRCESNPALHGIPDPPPFVQERIIWGLPVEAVRPPFLGANNDAFLDKQWLYVDQKTGFLYLTYTRFGADGSTPIELVRSFDMGQTWTPPSVIVPNLDDTFNQATQPVVSPNGRVIVTWFARTFALTPGFPEIEQRIETTFSDDGGNTFPPANLRRVDVVNPQGEPLGYNRNRFAILNAPYITVDKGRDDGINTEDEREQPGFGNVYITYFDGRTMLPAPRPTGPPQSTGNPFARAADILLARSTNNGNSYRTPVKVNDDPGDTTHVFSSVQVNQQGEVFVTWIDRRVDPVANRLNDTWGDISQNRGRSFAGDGRITTVSTDWFTREDARPDYGDYNSSEVINFKDFVSIWADGRFPPGSGQITPPPNPPRRRATPDTLFAIFQRAAGAHDDNP